jgi:hypothetical protein
VFTPAPLKNLLFLGRVVRRDQRANCAAQILYAIRALVESGSGFWDPLIR